MTLLAERHLWFQGSALEHNELQAPPAEVDNEVDQLTGSSRRSLDGSAFPGRAWERVFRRWCSSRSVDFLNRVYATVQVLVVGLYLQSML